ncbi:MAG: hypothetical protein K6G43_10110 [Lachnospiraceae bacterium]|nr:hypothetical protein [Lachnospiraceae bacterium]
MKGELIMIKLLSLDTSTRNTGYALYTNGELRNYGVLATKSKEPTDDMLLKLSELLNEYKPDIVVIENTVVLRNARVQRDLTQILGAVRFWSIQNGSCFYTLNPTEWRRLVKGADEVLPKSRPELKEWSIRTASDTIQKELADDNVSDAILIGVAYINLTAQKGEAV